MEHHYSMNRVLFVERSGELRLLARLSTEGAVSYTHLYRQAAFEAWRYAVSL